jgi:hypothetical protein
METVDLMAGTSGRCLSFPDNYGKDFVMNTGEMTSWLGFGTLILFLIIALIVWARFIRKPENRHPMRGQRERNIEEIRKGAEQPESRSEQSKSE